MPFQQDLTGTFVLRARSCVLVSPRGKKGYSFAMVGFPS